MLKYITQRIKSFKYAIRGLSFLWAEANFKIHVVSLILVIILAIFFDVSSSEWMWIVVSSTLVLITEAINTVIEKTLDFIQTKHDIRIGRLKDMSAAFVLIAALNAIIVAIIIFMPKIIEAVEEISSI